MKRLNFLFVSFAALIGDLAWAVKKEGHRVRYFIAYKRLKDVCDGFVEKVDEWKRYVDWADVIVFDDLGFGKEADRLRRAGKFVIGGSPYTDRLEDDREFGQSELKSAGVSTIPAWNFTSFDSAIRFIRKNPDRYVIKPSGSAQDEKELLFVGEDKDGADIAEMLQRYKKNWENKIKVFQLQKYVPGVEVAVGAFFNGKDFVMPLNLNFEHKRLFPGDLGPETGEMGTSMFFADKSPIFDATLAKMKDRLAASGYVGYIDVNCIANPGGIYPLEFTSRFGYPHISIAMEGVLSGWGAFLHGLAKKNDVRLRTKDKLLVGVVVSVPPFPFHDTKAFRKYSENASIIFKKDNLDGIHPAEVKMSNGHWHLAGRTGYALVVTGSGTGMEEARGMAYHRIRNIIIPNMFYRTDIGETWESDREKLTKWGYL